MIITHIEKCEWSDSKIVFTIPLPNLSPVFMSVDITEYGKENTGIVIVDADKFVNLWRSAPNNMHAEEANGSPTTWPNDYKYHHAEKGFSHGRGNPVPLADISYGESMRTPLVHAPPGIRMGECSEKIPYIAFTNGITRTIWLLSHGCSAFPVKCRMPGAQGLYHAAAAEGTSFHTLGEFAKIAAA